LEGKTQGSNPVKRIQGRGAWVEHRKADVRQVAGFGASGDDAARFLRELRQLRDGAGLGHAELAARAHFPYDSIRAAEVGPSLPDLPVLCAFVRGCGGTTEEWEERWRSLTRSPSLPVPASRTAGSSDAATAGARIGSVSQVGDSPDPSIIIAALSRVAEEMASPGVAVGTDISTGAVSVDTWPADDVRPADSVRPAEDLRPTEAVLPAAGEPAATDNAAGWDPIRVSTAWPVLRESPMVEAEPDVGGSAPWEAAPWAQGPSDADATAAGTADAAVTAVTAGTAARDAARATAAAVSASGVSVPGVGAAGGSGHAPSRTRVLVIAAVLLCVIAVLLAVFA
jgi:hypothetical protein